MLRAEWRTRPAARTGLTCAFAFLGSSNSTFFGSQGMVISVGLPALCCLLGWDSSELEP